MTKDLDEWRFHGGRVYDYESLKLPHVVSLIESLDYPNRHPVVIDVGGGECSVVHSARLPFRRHFLTATLDIAIPDQTTAANPRIKEDIEQLTRGEAPVAYQSLVGFLESSTPSGREVGADLIVYSEILNYVDFRQIMTWFDEHLLPGGYTVIANLPTRGWSKLFSEMGVKSHEELLAFAVNELGHEIVAQEYPRGATDDYEGFLVMATRKPEVPQQQKPQESGLLVTI